MDFEQEYGEEINVFKRYEGNLCPKDSSLPRRYNRHTECDYFLMNFHFSYPSLRYNLHTIIFSE